MEIILREIISGQNAQIQVMRGILEAKSMPQTNDCNVTVRQSAAQELKAVATQSTIIAAATSATETTEAAPANTARSTVGDFVNFIFCEASYNNFLYINNCYLLSSMSI
jgi:hypothetical protein